MKSDAGTKHSLVEPIHIYIYAALMMIQVMHDIPFQQCPHCIESYSSKFVLDRPGQWKSFFKDVVDWGIFDPSEPIYWTVLGFAL